VPDLDEFIAGIESAQSPAALWDTVLPFVDSHGIEKVSYHHMQGLGAAAEVRTEILTRGFPEDWVRAYVGHRLYLVDPIIEFASHATRPFKWSEVASLTKLSPEQKDYLDQLAAQHLGDGLAMQVFGPDLRNGYVGLGFAEGAEDLQPDALHALQWAAQVVHLRYCELVPAHGAGDLTLRESEVLGWIARGKSNSVIPDILGVSPHTVDTLVRRIYAKLDVTDRTTAAIKGVGTGLITLNRPTPA
jgi:LuxR family transcriptional regulator/LuxR family quorum-sensing system transcriptional regulator CciR